MQLRGSATARRLLRLAGWRVAFDGLPSRQGVVIVYPHTSNWDFIVGILAKLSIGRWRWWTFFTDAQADVAAIAARLGHHRGRRPEWAAPIRLKD